MRINVHPSSIIRPTEDLFGLFFEDLNHAADGGLYAELLINRDFSFDPVDRQGYHSLMGWAPLGQADMRVDTEDTPCPGNPNVLHVRAAKHAGIINLGFGAGICLKKGVEARLTLLARGKDAPCLKVKLGDAEGEIRLTDTFEKHTLCLKPSGLENGRLEIMLPSGGSFDLAFASLMPGDTWKGRENGLRKDLVEALYEMHPRFLRFPGGCLTHDGQLDPYARDGIYNWKLTTGPVENRPGRRNNWGYHQSMGLGFYEYFLLCEDLGCEPLPVLNGGLDPHHLRFAEGELLDRYIQDALDLIDFARGGTDTEWGRVRAEMGHPKPFGLTYLAIGNEEIHEQFHEHMAKFAEAIRKKAPDIRLIGSAGPVCAGGPFDMGWAYARKQGLELVDEHYYQAPEWFYANMDRYSRYPAEGPKVFLGEYASWGNTMGNALAEAAFMTEMEKTQSVGLACYAPLFCHVRYTNWQPDMIYFDEKRMCKTVNYHVQRMFMRNLGDAEVALDIGDKGKAEETVLPLGGRIQILADDTEMEIRDLTLDGKKTEDFSLMPEESREIGKAENDFTLSCTVVRKSGKKGLRIRFGYMDSKNFCQWTLGGWQNSDNAFEMVTGGRNSCLIQNNFSLEDQVAYRLCLKVVGRRLMGYVDDVLVCDIPVLPVIRENLYAAASVAQDGTLYLKAVNVLERAAEAEISIPGYRFSEGEVLEGPEDAENSLDHPECVVPHPAAWDGQGAYTFAPHSVTVLRFAKNG